MDRMTRLLLGGAGLLAAAVVAYGFVPLSDGILQVWYDVVAATAMLLGLSACCTTDRRIAAGWLLVLGGYCGWVLGDVVWDVEQHLLPGRLPGTRRTASTSARTSCSARARWSWPAPAARARAWRPSSTPRSSPAARPCWPPCS